MIVSVILLALWHTASALRSEGVPPYNYKGYTWFKANPGTKHATCSQGKNALNVPFKKVMLQPDQNEVLV